MGSGTTARIAMLNNRNFIGFEINEEYCKIITDRLQQTEKELVNKRAILSLF